MRWEMVHATNDSLQIEFQRSEHNTDSAGEANSHERKPTNFQGIPEGFPLEIPSFIKVKII